MITLHIHPGNDTTSHDDGVRTITFPDWKEFQIDHIGRSRIHAITVSDDERLAVRVLFHASFSLAKVPLDALTDEEGNSYPITYTDHNLNHILNNIECLKA